MSMACGDDSGGRTENRSFGNFTCFICGYTATAITTAINYYGGDSVECSILHADSVYDQQLMHCIHLCSNLFTNYLDVNVDTDDTDNENVFIFLKRIQLCIA